MCAESPGNRQTAAGLLTAGPTRSLAARGKRRASEGHCGGPSRRLDPSPGLAAGPGRAPHSRGRGSAPHPVPRRGSALRAPRSCPAQRFLGSDPARTPARTPIPPRRTTPQPGGRSRSRRRRSPYLSRAADPQAGAPGQQAPRCAGARGGGHRRSSVRAAAATSRRVALRSPITQRPGTASRAAEGRSETTGRW